MDHQSRARERAKYYELLAPLRTRGFFFFFFPNFI